MSAAAWRRLARATLLAACLATPSIGWGQAGAPVPSPVASPRPVPNASPSQVPADAPVLGVNVDLLGLAPAERARAIAWMRANGIRQLRMPVAWAEIEPEHGRFDWAELDLSLDALDQAGIAPLVTLHTSPAWARHDPPPAPHIWLCPEQNPAPGEPDPSRLAPPTDPADLARFAGRLAERYRSRLWAVEVWREPNRMPHWRAIGPDPEDYGRLLAATAAAIRSADPDALVVSAGLAPTTELGPCAMPDTVFLDRLARSGALAGVDAVGIQPFGLREGPSEAPAARERLNFARAELLHAVLARQGIERPLWALAWGWNAQLGPWSESESPWGTHPPAQAARWLGEGWARARAEWPWLGPMFVWTLRPAAAADDPAAGFGLLDARWQPTPLGRAVAEIAAGRAPAYQAPPAPETPRARLGRLAPNLLLLGFLALALGAAAWRWRARLAPPLLGALDRLANLGPAGAALLYAALVAANHALPWPAAFLAAAGLPFLAAARPTLAIAAVAAALPFWYAPITRLQLLWRPASPVELLVWVALAGRLIAAFAAAGSGRETPRPPGPRLARTAWLDWSALALLLWATLSLTWAEQPAPARHEWRMVILTPLFLYLLLRSARDRRAALQAAFDGLMLGGALAALWGLAGVGLAALGWSSSGAGGLLSEGVPRAQGPYGSANNLALVLGRLLPVAIAMAAWSSGPRRRAYALAGLPIGLGLVATFSRGALVLGLPALALYFLLVAGPRSRRVWLGIAAAAVAVLLLVAPFAGTARVRETLDPRPGTTGYIRLRLWQSAIAMGADHPWLGVGLDNFLYHYQDRYVQRDVIQERRLNHPHNLVLDWWTRLGLPGLLLLATLALGNLRSGARGIRLRRGQAEVFALAVGSLGMQVYALAQGWVDNSFFLVDLAALWWIGQAGVLEAAHGPEPAAPEP